MVWKYLLVLGPEALCNMGKEQGKLWRCNRERSSWVWKKHGAPKGKPKARSRTKEQGRQQWFQLRDQERKAEVDFSFTVPT